MRPALRAPLMHHRSRNVVQAASTPTIGLATAGDGSASVAFTPGAIPGTSYTVTSTPGGFTATGAASPLVPTGLTNGTAYTFTVRASGPGGDSAESGATGTVMPLWLWGVYPLWHASSTTPNADGAVSALADMSLATYPLSQGTGANQPTRGSGKIAFAGSHWLETSNATLAGWATGGSHTLMIVAEFSGSTPASGETAAGWGSTAAAARYSYIGHTSGDKALATQRHGGTAVSATDAANADATRRAYVGEYELGASGVCRLYVANSLVATSSTADPGSTAGDRFSFGGVYMTTIGRHMNGAIVVAMAMPRLATAGERTQWSAYLTAGCPPRSA